MLPYFVEFKNICFCPLSAGEFSQVIQETTLHKSIPFPFDSDFVKLYFGKNRSRTVTYSEFSQFLHDFHDEYANVAFKVRKNRS